MAWLRAGFSERSGGASEVYGQGELNLGWTQADLPRHVAENRRRWMQTVWNCREGLPDTSAGLEETLPELVTVAQVHSAESLVLGSDDPPRTKADGKTSLRGDGMMTAQPEVLLGIQTADCVPVLVADRKLRVVAGFHAGWRGAVARIVERGIAQMTREFGSRGGDLWAAVGPAIAGCCYSVGEEVHERFLAEFRDGTELFRPYTEPPKWQQTTTEDARTGQGGSTPGERAPWFLDLTEANRRQLLAAGVPGEQIDHVGGCTACSRTPEGRMQYFSHRAEHGRTGRMMALIGVRTSR